MSLGIAFKSPEGIVLAADSRVTLNQSIPQGNTTYVISSTFDNATKLLKVEGQKYVGAITYGLAAIGQTEPRTAHSFLPEFENELKQNHPEARLGVEDFATELSRFFMNQWNNTMPANYTGVPMVFIVGGYDPDAVYGRIFEFNIPSNPTPTELHTGQGVFGIKWGGQENYVTRLIKGIDPSLPATIKDHLVLDDVRFQALQQHIENKADLPIPYQFLPLQDCIDLSIYLIKITIQMQTWITGIRGVGGDIDVAVITRTKGFESIQEKEIRGERKHVVY